MMTNNKGFTLIEVIVTVVVLSLILIITTNLITTTLAASENTTYKLIKNNIVSAGYKYVDECSNGIIECNFDYQNNNTFKASILKQYGYFNDLNSPIDNKDLSDCLILTATKDDGVVLIELEDKCY